MFGFLRPCRHHLPPELHARWSEHLCGLCLALRDEAGQLARTTTHLDALGCDCCDCCSDCDECCSCDCS